MLQQEKEIETKSAEIIGGKIFKHWDELIQSTEGCWGGGRSMRLGHLCLLSLLEVRLLPSHRDWDTGVVSFLVITFQRDDSPVLEKDISGLLMVYILKGQRNNVQLQFS